MEPPLLRRANGRPQACDQCRARKLACDHAQPTCNRCSKRHQTCVYTVAPNPLPKPKPKHRGGLTPRPRTAASSTPTPPCSGYLGFTSHSAVFEETRTSLTLANGALGGVEPKRHRARCSAGLPKPLRDMSLFVLRNLPGPDDALNYESTPCRPDNWILHAVQRIVRTLRRVFGSRLDHDGSLEECAQAISANTARPFREENIDAQEWIDQFAGDTLRWESIALIWTFWETSDVSTVGVSLKYCIELALHFAPSNDLVLYLCYRRSTMESIIRGDASNLPPFSPFS